MKTDLYWVFFIGFVLKFNLKNQYKINLDLYELYTPKGIYVNMSITYTYFHTYFSCCFPKVKQFLKEQRVYLPLPLAMADLFKLRFQLHLKNQLHNDGFSNQKSEMF